MSYVDESKGDSGRLSSEHGHELEILDRNTNGEISQDEQSRLLISAAIIAGFFAYLQVGYILDRYIGVQPTKAIGLTLGLSSILSFLYLLTIAAALKHTRWGYIDAMQLNFFQKVAFYDLSVDVLALVPVMALLTSFIDYGIIRAALLVVGLALVIGLVSYAFPYLWVSYEIKASCPECAAKLDQSKYLTRWRKFRPKMINEVMHLIIVLIIFILIKIFVYS